MSDVRERVAMAIWLARENQFPARTRREWDALDDATGVKADVFAMADAALSAIGYEEIVGALETVIRVCDSDWPESRGPHVTIDAVRYHARAALRKARGETLSRMEDEG